MPEVPKPPPLKHRKPNSWTSCTSLRYIRYDAVYKRSGRRYPGIWNEVQRVAEDVCDHVTSVCDGCVQDWMAEGKFSTSVHGSYSLHCLGCICRRCTQASLEYNEELRGKQIRDVWRKRLQDDEHEVHDMREDGIQADEG